MIKFVLDTDAAVKLAKAGVLSSLSSSAKCFMSKLAYEEVLKGKEKMHEDAFAVEGLANVGKIKIMESKTETIEGLGIGECSSLSLFQKVKADAVISDDRKFLLAIEKDGIPFLTSTSVITWLTLKKHISKLEALEALESIKNLVREENYRNAKKMIGGN